MPEFIGKRGQQSLLAILFLLLGGMILCACGGSTDSGASELARQRELAEARKQAAQDARQSAHIEDLERRLKSISRENEGRGQTEEAPATAPSTPTGTGDQEHNASSGDWPGGSGFTAILASLSSEAEANSIQAEATAGGLDAGVLYSSNFSSLRPGYWVVFSGVFPDASGAATRTTRAHELGYADAYPRFVSP